MSKAAKSDFQKLLRNQIVKAVGGTAKEHNVAIHAEGVAALAQPRLLFVNVPAAGLKKVDFKKLLDGRAVLDGSPIMLWHLSGDALSDAAGSIPAGFYTVVTDQKKGKVRLRDARNEVVAEGVLRVCVGTPPKTIAKVTVKGGIDSADAGLVPPHVKICGHVTASDGKRSVTINACFEAGL